MKGQQAHPLHIELARLRPEFALEQLRMVVIARKHDPGTGQSCQGLAHESKILRAIPQDPGGVLWLMRVIDEITGDNNDGHGCRPHGRQCLGEQSGHITTAPGGYGGSSRQMLSQVQVGDVADAQG